jgi:hypothetical protein
VRRAIGLERTTSQVSRLKLAAYFISAPRAREMSWPHTKSRYKLERERRAALDEIERIERLKRLKSEREAKLTGALWNVRVIVA